MAHNETIVGMAERKLPPWLRVVLNLCGPIGLGVTLMGWVKPIWGIGVMIVGIAYLVWEIYPWVKDQIRGRPRMSLVVLVVIGASLGAAAWWYIRKSTISTVPVAASLPQPRFKLGLILDSITEKEVTWHLDLETDHTVENIRVRYVATGGTEDEREPPFPRSLASGEKLSLLGPPLLRPNAYNHLNVTLTYVLPGHTTDQFGTTFHFFVMANATGVTFHPESVEGPIKITESMQGGGDNLAAALQQPRAVLLHMTLNEVTPDGKPNIVNGGNQVRTINFNPVNRTASFAIKFPSGKSLLFVGPLGTRLNGFHQLQMSWDDAKDTAAFVIDEIPAKAVMQQ